MKIGVVSDTHSQPIPKQLLDDFKKVDFIIHAGDFCDTNDLEIFKKVAKVQAVYGNMDDSRIRKLFPARQILKCGLFSIGIFHGEGSAQKILDRVQAEFKNDKVHAVIFGHSHQPFNEKINSVLYFNPGSPNDQVRAPYCSYGILDVTADDIAGFCQWLTSHSNPRPPGGRSARPQGGINSGLIATGSVSGSCFRRWHS